MLATRSRGIDPSYLEMVGMMPPDEFARLEAIIRSPVPQPDDTYALTNIAGMVTDRVPNPPTIPEMQEEVGKLKQLYNLRNNDILDMRRVIWQAEILSAPIRMGRRTNTWLDNFILRLSLPHTIMRRFASVMNDGKQRVQVVSPSQSLAGEMQSNKLEAFCRRYASLMDRDWREGGHSDTLDTARAEMLFQDGQIYQCLLPEPNRRHMPLRTYVWDTLDVLPVISEKVGIRRCYYTFRCTVEELREEWGANCCVGRRLDDVVNVVVRYDSYYLCAYVEGNEWVKKPVAHDMGMTPVWSTFVQGRQGRTESIYGSDQQRMAAMGRGGLWLVRSEFDLFGKLMTAAAKATVMQADPMLWVELAENGSPFAIDVRPAKVMEVPAGTKAQWLSNPAALPALQITLDRLWNNIQAATFSIDPQRVTASGYQTTVIDTKEQVFFAPYVAAMQSHTEREFERALTIFKNTSPPIVAIDRTQQGTLTGVECKPSDVPNDVEVVVTYHTLRPAEKLQMIAVGQGAVGTVFSRKTFQRDYLQMENDDLEDLRMLEERAELLPDVQAVAMEPYAVELLQRIAQARLERGDQEGAQMWAAMAEAAAQKMQMGIQEALTQPAGDPASEMPPEDMLAMLQAQQQGPPPGQLPPGFDQGQQPEEPGIAPQFMPPEAQGDMDADPYLQALRSQMNPSV